jgi:membrane protease YdiL (CAAX protease family)
VGVDLVQVIGWLLWLHWLLGPFAVAITAAIVWHWALWPIGDWLTKAGQIRLGAYYHGFISEVGWAGPLLLFLVLEERQSGRPHVEPFLEFIKLRPDIFAHELAVGAGLLVAFYVVGAVSGWVSTILKEKITEHSLLMQPRTFAERAVWVGVVSPQAGFFEEIMARGLWLAGLMSFGVDAGIAIIVTSAAFGLLHWGYGTVWVFGSAVLGAMAAIVVVTYDSLWPAIFAHTVYDMTVHYIFGDVTADESDGQDAPVPAQVRG